MEKERSEVEREFYEKCAELLCVEHIYKKCYSKRTRWNNRDPGNGRFEGYGLIRRYSSNHIHLIFTNPITISKTFKSEDDVILFLKSITL
jgi:hypothetical protein